MPIFSTILTHPGGAHKDEFLACSVLLAVNAAPIVRREPTAADLEDPSICVVDVGHAHDPALNNFDHHQLPKDQPPTCALSLVLQHLGLYEDARAFCEWLEPAEWFDCRGPFSTADRLSVDREVLAKLNSPLDATLLRRFASTTMLNPGQPLWEIMHMVGQDLIEYLRSLRARLDLLAAQAQVWDVPLEGLPAKVLFLPRAEPPLDDPSMGIDRYIESIGQQDTIVATVTPDRRGQGYGLSRHRDHARMDFTRIAGHTDVHFAHARGFVAKTSATDIARLQELLRQSAVA
jgi:hypothetical protein